MALSEELTQGAGTAVETALDGFAAGAAAVAHEDRVVEKEVPVRSPRTSPLWLLAGYVVVTAVFIALIAYAANGVRGSDQYWNLGNVERLIEGDSKYTNCVYAGPLLRGEYALADNYFIHHTLSLYIAAFIGSYTGAYAGWLIMNVLASLAAAALIAIGLHRFAGAGWGLIGFTIYLLMPLTIWQGGNLLQESLYGFFATLLAVSAMFAGRAWWSWLMITIIGCIGSYANPIFMPVTMAAPFGYLLLNRDRLNAARIIGALSLIVMLLGSHMAHDRVLPSTLQRGLGGIIVGVIPGEGNMEWHLRTEPPAITTDLLLSKVMDAVRKQFSRRSIGVFYWPINLLMLLSLVALARRWKEPAMLQLAVAGFMLLGGYCVVVVLHQNQFRYGLFIAGPAVIGGMLALQSFSPRGLMKQLRTAVIAIGILGLLVVATMMVRRLHVSGREDADLIAQIQAATADLPVDAATVVEAHSSGHPLLLSYALQPRWCLIVQSGSMTEAELAEILDQIKPKVAFATPGESGLPGTNDPNAGLVFADGKYADMRMFWWPEIDPEPMPSEPAPTEPAIAE